MGKLSKLVQLLENHTISGSSFKADDAVSEKITPRQIIQSRLNFGVNLGGCFIREKWIFPSLFPEGAETELQATKKDYEANKQETKNKLEDFWKTFVSEDDWKWLQEHGVNSVRIPIGYWNVDGGKFTKGTKFADVAGVYDNSWKIFKSHFIEPAGKHDISVVVDLHGLPGGANSSDHSGEEAGGKAEFWLSSSYQKLAVDALQFIAKDLKSYDNIAGIQVINEAEFSDSAKDQKLYYTLALKAIRQHDGSIPVIISDGWWPNQFAQWVQKEQGLNCAGIVIDHHAYRTFSDDDRNKDADTIIHDLNDDLLTNLENGGSGVDFMVGEWSNVLDGNTWKKSGLDPGDNQNQKRMDLVSKFCKKQTQLFRERASFGSYFWTYKFESGNGGEWDFKQQHDTFDIPRVSVPDENKFKEVLDHEFKSHVDYWTKTEPNGKFDHDKFKDGFTTAWNDSVAFAKANAFIGRTQAVKIARKLQCSKKYAKLDFIWEWEQGYDKAVEQFAKSI